LPRDTLERSREFRIFRSSSETEQENQDGNRNSQ
jgi:hypothetical protein